jgi:hypothetical protein
VQLPTRGAEVLAVVVYNILSSDFFEGFLTLVADKFRSSAVCFKVHLRSIGSQGIKKYV